MQRVSYEGGWKHNYQDFSFEALLVVTDSEEVEHKPHFKNKLSADVIFFHEASDFSDDFWDARKFR